MEYKKYFEKRDYNSREVEENEIKSKLKFLDPNSLSYFYTLMKYNITRLKFFRHEASQRAVERKQMMIKNEKIEKYIKENGKEKINKDFINKLNKEFEESVERELDINQKKFVFLYTLVFDQFKRGLYLNFEGNNVDNDEIRNIYSQFMNLKGDLFNTLENSQIKNSLDPDEHIIKFCKENSILLYTIKSLKVLKLHNAFKLVLNLFK